MLIVLTLVSSTWLLALPVFSEETPKPPRKLEKGEVYISVPKLIQQDLHDRAVDLAKSVYPDVDKEVIRKVCSEAFLKDCYHFQYLDALAITPCVGVPGSPGVGSDFPWPERVSVHTEHLPPGVVLKPRDKPLTVGEAKEISYMVLTRIVKQPNDVKQFQLEYSGESRPDNVFEFNWARKKTEHKADRYLWYGIVVREQDGLVTRVDQHLPIRKPKISSAEISSLAKKSGLNGWLSDIRLESRNFGGRLRLIWRYESPPTIDGGGGPNDTTIWDADTGEILLSMRLNGGTPDKPYGEEGFYRPAKEEDYIPNLQEQIRIRVKELEEEQAAKSKK